MTAMPYLAVLAGSASPAASGARGRDAGRRARACAVRARGSRRCLPARGGRDAALASRRLSHYNLLAGGFAGGHRWG
jgi:hypothetical protein